MKHYLTFFSTTILDMKIWMTSVLLQISFSAFFTKYVFSDLEFLKWLFIAMAVDLLTGIVKVWKTQGYQAITSRGLRDTILKFIQYGAFLIITHVLTSFEIAGKPVTNWSWLSKIAYEFILLIEVKSVYENLVVINPKLDIFSKVIKKIAEFLPKSSNDQKKD